MPKSFKTRALGGLAKSLSYFDPSAKDVFRCPACLRDVPIDRPAEITVAHLIPQYAAGTLTTWLCKACNSKFGSRQDKWFGEYARLRTMVNPSVLDSKIKAPTFDIGGIRVAGVLEEGEDGGLNAYIHSTRNSPETLARLEEHFRTFKVTGESSMIVTIPFLQKRFETTVGFLTCAYLLWFKHLGYSFALQTHLDPIRKQLANSDSQLIPLTYEGVVKECFPRPWISVGFLETHPILAAGILDRVIILPSSNRPRVLDSLDPKFVQHHLSGLVPVPVDASTRPVGPIGLLLGTETFVMPDVLRNNPNFGRYFMLHPDGSKPAYLHPISKEEFERQKSLPHVFSKINGPTE